MGRWRRPFAAGICLVAGGCSLNPQPELPFDGTNSATGSAVTGSTSTGSTTTGSAGASSPPILVEPPSGVGGNLGNGGGGSVASGGSSSNAGGSANGGAGGGGELDQDGGDGYEPADAGSVDAGE